jgi:hypothetical protein
VTGRYGDWWQIDYGGTPGWVAGWVVTSYNTDSVAEVVPPASPIPPTAAPVPTKTPAPAPAAECRGLVADGFQVEGVPGPYPRGESGAEIWFNLWFTNKTDSEIEYRAFGVAALKDGEQVVYQGSYFGELTLGAHKQKDHRDHIFITEPGTYQLWLRVGFHDDYWCSLAGPVEVIVE